MTAAWFETFLFFAALALAARTVQIAARSLRSPGGTPPSGRPGPDTAHPPMRNVSSSGPGHPTTAGRPHHG